MGKNLCCTDGRRRMLGTREENVIKKLEDRTMRTDCLGGHGLSEWASERASVGMFLVGN